jgi:steroid delta-isomerase-like uncharacterized protein
MSTEENKAVVRRIWEEILNQGNLALVDEIIATNYVYHGPGGPEIKGSEGLKQFFTMYRNAFPDFHSTIEDMVAEGDKVVCRVTWRGTHKGEMMGIAPTGKQVTGTRTVIHRIVGGKEVEGWDCANMLDTMQQLGVVPPIGQGGG